MVAGRSTAPRSGLLADRGSTKSRTAGALRGAMYDNRKGLFVTQNQHPQGASVPNRQDRLRAASRRIVRAHRQACGADGERGVGGGSSIGLSETAVEQFADRGVSGVIRPF